MTRRGIRRRCATALVLGLVAAVGFGGSGGAARAQSQAGAAASSLGGFQGSAASSGLYAFYTPKGLLPIGSIVDLGVPDALATIASGPSTFARASAADPGDIVANPDAVLALASPDYPQGTIPAYPYRVAATSGFGSPTASSTPAPGLSARVEARPEGSTAQATMPMADAPAVATFGSLSSLATTATDGSKVTVRVRTRVSNFNLFNIALIDSIVTDLTAVSDGKGTRLSGGTLVSGASVLGTPVMIDSSGVRSGNQPGEGGLSGLGTSLNEVLKSAGLKITLPDPVRQRGGTSGQLGSSGVRIDFELSERTLPVLAALGDAVPTVPELAPGTPTVDDLVVAARAQHLTRLDLAKGFVSLSARGLPAALDAVSPLLGGDSPTGSAAIPGTSGTAGSDGTLSTGGASLRAPASVSPAATTRRANFPLGTGVGALALLLLLAQPFVGTALARAASTVLGVDDAASCPREERSP